MTEKIRQQVRSRANHRCEYCRLPQTVVSAKFHIEHVRAIQHGGLDHQGNLALACDRCNVFKGTNLTSVDPATGAVVVLFNPRTQIWTEHFNQDGYEIVGITDTGRATVRLLKMNALGRVQLRMGFAVDLLL